MNKDILLKFIVTFGFIGKIKKAPGTFGSVAALPFFFLLERLVYYAIDINGLSNIMDIEPLVVNMSCILIAIIILFMLGWYSSSLYIRKYPDNNDPKEIVIDEVVGQMLTYFLCLWGIFIIQAYCLQKGSSNCFSIALGTFILLPFILFRIFDIFKPWPINWIDSKVKGGLGIMLDDVLAAVFAAVVFYTIIFNFIVIEK